MIHADEYTKIKQETPKPKAQIKTHGPILRIFFVFFVLQIWLEF